jgi:chromosome segregation protein
MEESSPELSKLEDEIATTDSLMNKMDDQVTKTSQNLIDDKIRLALLDNRKENLQKDLRKLDRELRAATEELDRERNRASEVGPQVAVVKSIDEILDEMRLNDGYVAALTDVSEDVERMYESYSKLYLELKDKAQLVAESREKALVEVRTRMDSWRTVIRTLLDHVNVQYQTILANAQAEGEVRLVNEQDIEAAGLQIFVGFKGARPVPLDAYTQSGGERSTATVTFLLALQQHVRSQFRAVDEYDIHMDPKNREIIARMIIASIGSADSQYLVITPSQITFADRSINLITVQNIEGTSLVKEVH